MQDTIRQWLQNAGPGRVLIPKDLLNWAVVLP